MALTVKGVNGDLPAAVAAIYTCPASTAAIVKSIWLANTSVDPIEIEIGTGRGASNKVILHGWLGPYECLQPSTLVMLAAGETLRGLAGAGATIAFDLAIIERSV